MTILKKSLLIAALAGLGLSFMPQAKAVPLSQATKAYEALRQKVVVGGAVACVSGLTHVAMKMILNALGVPIHKPEMALSFIAAIIPAYVAADTANESVTDRWNSMGFDSYQQDQISKYLDAPTAQTVVAGAYGGFLYGIYCLANA